MCSSTFLISHFLKADFLFYCYFGIDSNNKKKKRIDWVFQGNLFLLRQKSIRKIDEDSEKQISDPVKILKNKIALFSGSRKNRTKSSFLSILLWDFFLKINQKLQRGVFYAPANNRSEKSIKNRTRDLQEIFFGYFWINR